ncbi:MAG: type IV pilin-like G/H family protein [Pseudanabaenaceae cyanobacterium bins.39]|nr:type IV pilin-like G/H family protein [Pseudanabaenaceae cyanobacterium bins.39]
MNHSRNIALCKKSPRSLTKGMVQSVRASINLINLVNTQSPANRARQSEARNYVGTMNRGQQAVFLETGKFAGTVAELAIGIRDKTENYNYRIMVLDVKNAVQQVAIPKNNSLKSYIGLVYVDNSVKPSEMITQSLLCESIKPMQALPPKFKLTGTPTCPEGYVRIGN